MGAASLVWRQSRWDAAPVALAQDEDPFLKRVGHAAVGELRERVAREITTTFASGYHREVSLAEALQLDTIAAYGRQSTGEKVLINPGREG